MAALAGRGRVLIVDDDEDVRETFQTLLELASYEVYSARNGKEALEVLRREWTRRRAPDVIVLDLRMPVMDGWQFRLAQLREPGLAQIPVVAVSADSSAQAAAVDADGFLHKPLTREELISTVTRLALEAQARRLQDERLAHSERLRNLGQVAAEVAHEINNSLAYLTANLRCVDRALADPAPPIPEQLEETRSAITDAIDGAERIERIVADIAVFSREADDRERVIELRAVLDSALKVVHGRLRSRAEVVRDYQGEPRVLGSAGRLGQVFLNLLINAGDAIPPGQPSEHRITLATRVEDGKVVIDVTDTGAGIPPDVVERIFDRFFTTKPVGVGTGLGLFVSQSLVREMGGELSVTTEVDKGSTFRVTLPLAEEPHEAIPEGLDAGRPEDVRILLVDDEQPVLRGLQRLLAPLFQVETASSGQEALDRLRGDGARFDLVLCDLHMPGKGGKEVWEELQAQQPGYEERLAFMTAGILDPRVLSFAQGLRAPVLEKPVEPNEVIDLVLRMKERRTSNLPR